MDMESRFLGLNKPIKLLLEHDIVLPLPRKYPCSLGWFCYDGHLYTVEAELRKFKLCRFDFLIFLSGNPWFP